MSRNSTIEGTVTVAIDTRRNDNVNGQYLPIVDVLPLMILLHDLCGDDTQVFFDFGVISLINVDLGKLRERFETKVAT